MRVRVGNSLDHDSLVSDALCLVNTHQSVLSKYTRALNGHLKARARDAQFTVVLCWEQAKYFPILLYDLTWRSVNLVEDYTKYYVCRLG